MYYSSLFLALFIIPTSLTAQSPLFPWVENNQLGYIDTLGQFYPSNDLELLYPNSSPFSSSLKSYKEMNYWGFKDEQNNIVIPAGYERVGNFSNGYTWVKMDHKRYYYIDRNGKELLTYTFDRAYDFSDGLARVKDIYPPKGYNGYGFLNTSGLVAIPLVYDNAMDFIVGFALVKNKDGWWLIDKNGVNQFGPCSDLKLLKGNTFTK